MARVITLIPGDGIGPEVTEAVVRTFHVAGLDIEWERYDAGVLAFKRFNQSLPAELLDSIKRNKVALKGPVTTPIAEGITSVNVGLRKALDLYANLRPVRNLPGVVSRFTGVDLVIVRENTEDLYSGLEHEVVPGVVESLKIITERASTRSRVRLQPRRGERPQARNSDPQGQHHEARRRHVPGKPRKVSRAHTEVAYDERIVDAVCMQLVMFPERFDVLVLPNLYGDIVSDLCAGLVGGLGVVPGANLGTEIAVFEAVHGSAPDIANKNLANPTALLLSGLMMLDHIGERDAAGRIRTALEKVLPTGRFVPAISAGRRHHGIHRRRLPRLRIPGYLT